MAPFSFPCFAPAILLLPPSPPPLDAYLAAMPYFAYMTYLAYKARPKKNKFLVFNCLKVCVYKLFSYKFFLAEIVINM